MRERFAHLSYIHQGSDVSVTALLAHLCHMHRGPTVGATELSTEIPQVHWSSLLDARQRLTSPISLYLLYLHRRYLIGFPGIVSERTESK